MFSRAFINSYNVAARLQVNDSDLKWGRATRLWLAHLDMQNIKINSQIWDVALFFATKATAVSVLAAMLTGSDRHKTYAKAVTPPCQYNRVLAI